MKLFLTLAFAIAASAIPSVSSAKSGVETLVVGGEDAELGEMPYQLSFQTSTRHSCGAVLIEPGLALTAAHCIQTGRLHPLTLVGGKIDITTDGGQKRVVKEIIPHPDYNHLTLSNDICLLTVTENFNITSTLGTIAIPPEHFVTSGNLLLSGWGKLGEDKPSSSILQKVVIPFVADDSCREHYSGEENVPPVLDSMLCAGTPEGGKGVCNGDSGGPLVSLGTKYLVGIVSWSRGCARPNLPSVFTEIAYFTDWINKQKKKLLHL